MRLYRLVAVLLVVALAGTVAVGTALADGDPASDILPSQDVFLPYNTVLSGKLSPTDRQLVATVAAANHAGYRIKVAVISSGYDLGSVTGLIGKPRTYARFLGQELGYLYSGPLLIVMQDGFGVYDGKRPVASEQRLLRAVAIRTGANGLQEAATAAVARLAASSGHPIEVPAEHSGGAGLDRAVIAGAGAALLALLVSVSIVWARRRRAA
jgi:hypothetical protein